MTRKHAFILGATLLLSLAGCATNPVTGERELSLVSTEKELAIGAQQYEPARQSQGGDFILDPALTAYISEVGNRLAAVSDRKLPYEFKIINSSVPNAWALPGGKIAVNRGLLTYLHNEAELAAVLGHEIVHAAAKHAVRQISRGMLLQTGVVAAVVGAQNSGYGNLAQMGAGLAAQLLSTKYGRDAEREADHYGMIYMSRAGYDPQGAVELQRTFVKLSAGRNQDWLSGMFASHPASEERVQNNLNMLQKLPQGGEVGAARYKSKLTYLNKIKPAYDAYDKGRKALAKKDIATAKKFAKQAINIEPKEALFYDLAGDIALSNKQPQSALKQYNKAISSNPNFFYGYLMRGQIEYKLKQNQKAKADLEKSLTMLPTGNAYLVLGHIAKAEQDIAQAKSYYTKVASNKGKVGIAAYTALLELDLQEHPNKYLKMRVGKSNQGGLAVEIANPTPKNIGGLQVLIQVADASGNPRRIQRNLKGSVAAGKKRVFDLGLQGLSDQQLQSLKGKIIAARLVN